MKRTSEKFLILAALLFVSVGFINYNLEELGVIETASATYNSDEASLVELAIGVPDKIIWGAVNNGGVKVFLFGNADEKHRFAKGYSTQYGKLGFSADDYLKYSKGWSEEKIHRVGKAYGFSELWNPSKN